jgi:hypothetical protein
VTHAKKELSKIILRKIKNFIDKLLGDYADELYQSYLIYFFFNSNLYKKPGINKMYK